MISENTELALIIIIIGVTLIFVVHTTLRPAEGLVLIRGIFLEALCSAYNTT